MPLTSLPILTTCIIIFVMININTERKIFFSSIEANHALAAGGGSICLGFVINISVGGQLSCF